MTIPLDQPGDELSVRKRGREGSRTLWEISRESRIVPFKQGAGRLVVRRGRRGLFPDGRGDGCNDRRQNRYRVCLYGLRYEQSISHQLSESMAGHGCLELTLMAEFVLPSLGRRISRLGRPGADIAPP